MWLMKTLLTSGCTNQRGAGHGAKVVIVTGRHHVAIHPFYQALELDTPAICCNGALLYDYLGKRVLASDPLLPDQARQLVALLDAHNVHGLMYADDAMFYSESTGHITRTETWARSLPENQRPVFNTLIL
ncbi:phosphotransferase [Escherichia coli]|nr:phosphotransferase [Escherichia coli]